jgi:hypothetical protein
MIIDSSFAEMTQTWNRRNISLNAQVETSDMIFSTKTTSYDDIAEMCFGEFFSASKDWKVASVAVLFVD